MSRIWDDVGTLLIAIVLLLSFWLLFIPYFIYHRIRYDIWPWDLEDSTYYYDEDWDEEVEPSCKYCTRARWNGFEGKCSLKGSVYPDDCCEDFKPKLLFKIDKWLENVDRSQIKRGDNCG